MNKKVLIITYYWPPSGGSGVQRWLKFVKYLPQFGWEPFVFTPENPSFSIRDDSLLNDVPEAAEIIRFPIWEPYNIFLRVSGSDKSSLKPITLVSNKKKPVSQKIATWIRANIFIPDPRIFWVKPSARFLNDFIRDNEIKVVITTGPPHSLHLIGYRLKKKNPSLRWLADFRDPWSQWGFLDSLGVNSIVRKVHKRLEAKVLSTADTVITITPFYVRQFSKLAKREVKFLPNGFDEEDFKNVPVRKSDKFLIRHVGIVNEKCDPRPFIMMMKELISENKDFAEKVKMEFIGEVHPLFESFVKEDNVVSSVIFFRKSIPHKELLEEYGKSSLLLLVLHGYKDAEGYMPGKLFEYMATGLPILGIGPIAGDAAALLHETKAGDMIEATNTNGMKTFLIRNFERWKNNEPLVANNSSINRYSRRELTRRLTELL